MEKQGWCKTSVGLISGQCGPSWLMVLFLRCVSKLKLLYLDGIVDIPVWYTAALDASCKYPHFYKVISTVPGFNGLTIWGKTGSAFKAENPIGLLKCKVFCHLFVSELSWAETKWVDLVCDELLPVLCSCPMDWGGNIGTYLAVTWEQLVASCERRCVTYLFPSDKWKDDVRPSAY